MFAVKVAPFFCLTRNCHVFSGFSCGVWFALNPKIAADFKQKLCPALTRHSARCFQICLITTHASDTLWMQKQTGETVVAVIDFDVVVDMEGDAKAGKPQALYQLGLCYSTGQGVELDLVRAHKYFNLAAMKGVAEARLWRAELAQQMTSNDIAEAQRLARLWLQETAH
ncbi:MAG: tetratricopeptide repeat protein [Micropepsaceae bacterium]